MTETTNDYNFLMAVIKKAVVNTISQTDTSVGNAYSVLENLFKSPSELNKLSPTVRCKANNEIGIYLRNNPVTFEQDAVDTCSVPFTEMLVSVSEETAKVKETYITPLLNSVINITSNYSENKNNNKVSSVNIILSDFGILSNDNPEYNEILLIGEQNCNFWDGDNVDYEDITTVKFTTIARYYLSEANELLDKQNSNKIISYLYSTPTMNVECGIPELTEYTSTIDIINNTSNCIEFYRVVNELSKLYTKLTEYEKSNAIEDETIIKFIEKIRLAFVYYLLALDVIRKNQFKDMLLLSISQKGDAVIIKDQLKNFETMNTNDTLTITRACQYIYLYYKYINTPVNNNYVVLNLPTSSVIQIVEYCTEKVISYEEDIILNMKQEDGDNLRSEYYLIFKEYNKQFELSVGDDDIDIVINNLLNSDMNDSDLITQYVLTYNDKLTIYSKLWISSLYETYKYLTNQNLLDQYSSDISLIAKVNFLTQYVSEPTTDIIYPTYV